MKTIGIYLERRPESGGAYQYCLAMLRALSELPSENYDIVAFCTYEDWRKVTQPLKIRTELVQKNILQKCFYYVMEKILPVSCYRRSVGKSHPLYRRQKKLKVDYCIYPCGDKISFMLQTPAVVSVFDLLHRYLTQFPEIADPKIYKSRERSYTNIARYAKMILVDSEMGKQQMIDCYDTEGNLGEKIESLPFIAPDYIYENVNGEKQPKPQIVFDKYIFYPAQLWKHKNHKNLLLAMVGLKQKNRIVNAVFCGSGKNAAEEIEQIIREHGLEKQVQILGYVSNQEMVGLYQYARALVMPTYAGPTNIPQLEAFLLGCPVATSRIFGIPQQVGEAALLFDPDDVNEIAECVEKLWVDDSICEELRRKGYEQSERWGKKQFQEKLSFILESMNEKD